MRIPGVGLKSVSKIIAARRFQKLNIDHLKKLGVALNRAKFFVEFDSLNPFTKYIDDLKFREIIVSGMKSKWQKPFSQQLALF